MPFVGFPPLWSQHFKLGCQHFKLGCPSEPDTLNHQLSTGCVASLHTQDGGLTIQGSSLLIHAVRPVGKRVDISKRVASAMQ